MRSVIARAPTRIDFGGGWTDVPPYATEQGGRVCNLAIARYAEVRVEHASGTANDVRSAPGSPFAAAAARRVGVSGIRSTLRSNFPTGAGLGGSSAIGVATLAALHAWAGHPRAEPAILAEESRAVEVDDLGIAGGRQDHYSAVFGGALDLQFGDTTAVRRLSLESRVQESIQERCLIVYTGQSRVSADTITAVLDAYGRRDRAVMEALARMRALAGDMAIALERGDLDALGELMADHWVWQRSLHPSIPTDRIDALLATARAHGAHGGKALGASGGGCVAVLAAGHAVEAVRAAITPLGLPLTFTIDTGGVAVEELDA